MSPLQELLELSESLINTSVGNWERQHGKVVGFFCSYVPEEILYALQLLPYRVRPAGCKQTTSADVCMSHLNCTFVRCCLEFALGGKYEFLDGLVFINSCDHIHRLHDVWRHEIRCPFTHFVDVPHKINDLAINRYKDEILDLKESLEKSFGLQMTEEGLENAVEVYNETRSLLRELYELRKKAAPPITGAEAHSIVLAASTTPKEQYNQLLKKALEEIRGKEGVSRYKARVMIVGSGLDDPNYIRMIEDQGALVVTDALCFGSRYFWKPVEIEDDLLLGLAKSYLERPHCARMIEGCEARHNYIKEMVKDFRVDGVICQTMRYCDSWANEAFRLRQTLEEANIPVLSLEREYILTSRAQVNVRVQAFLEMLGG